MGEEQFIQRLIDILARFDDDYEVAPEKNDHEFWTLKARFTAGLIYKDAEKYFKQSPKKEDSK